MASGSSTRASFQVGSGARRSIGIDRRATPLQRAPVEAALREDVLRKLERIAGHRLSQDCVLVLTHGGSYAERNREDALRRLIELIGQATKQPQQRTQTAPTWAAGVVACEP